MNSLNLVGTLSQPWESIAAKASGKTFYKNILRGKAGYDTAAGERVEKDWAIELIAFSHTGNSLAKHTKRGDLLAVSGSLQSTERDSNDGTRTFLNHSMAVDRYHKLAGTEAATAKPADSGAPVDYGNIPF